MPKVTPAHEQKRREQILAGAMACFARQGYRATSMEDIVHECGLSVGAIYSYYPSKRELFHAIADRRMQQSLEELTDLFSRPRPIADKMNEAVDYFFSFLDDDQLPYVRTTFESWSESWKADRLGDESTERCAGIRHFLHWLLDESKARGELRSDVDVPAAAELMMALNDGILLHHISGVQPVEREALKAAYITLFNQGFAPPANGLMAAASRG